jgi:hypothetical protein
MNKEVPDDNTDRSRASKQLVKALETLGFDIKAVRQEMIIFEALDFFTMNLNCKWCNFCKIHLILIKPRWFEYHLDPFKLLELSNSWSETRKHVS